MDTVAHLLLGAALSFPDVSGHNTFHLLPKTWVLLELEKGQEERKPRTHRAWASGTQPHLSTGTQGCEVEDMQGKTSQAKKRALEPQEADGTSHGHSFHPSVASKWHLKGLPGSRTIFTGPPGQFQWARGSLHGENHRKGWLQWPPS